MSIEIQAKGLQHIRNLKKFANKIHKNYDCCPGVWIDCIEAALINHRVACLKQKRLEEEKITESGNPS